MFFMWVLFRVAFQRGLFRTVNYINNLKFFFIDIQHVLLQSNITCFYVKFSQYSYIYTYVQFLPFFTVTVTVTVYCFLI